MTAPPSLSVVVLLVEADTVAADSLRPAAEILESFGVGTERITLTPGGPIPSNSGNVCAVIVASSDAALPATLAAHTPLPVIRVPTPDSVRSGLALLTDAGNLPAGPTEAAFATMAIGEPGAKNAALFVVASLAATHDGIRLAWGEFRARQTEVVLQHPPLSESD